jgi:hypothetical protein
VEGFDISEKEKIQDIPSFAEARSDVKNLDALKSAYVSNPHTIKTNWC